MSVFSGVTSKTALKRIVSYIGGTNYELDGATDIEVTDQEYLAIRSLQATGAASMYAIQDKPDIMLWFVPLNGAQLVEVAKSQDILKFRSVGGQFLAHQKGGSFAVRIDAKLKGPNALTTLTALQILHMFGDVNTVLNPGIRTSTVNVSTSAPPRNTPYSRTRDGTNSNTITDNIAPISDYTWLQSSKHYTYPIMTKSEILFDMYIESMIYWRTNNREDKDVINISILCRRFVPDDIIMNYGIYDTKGAEVATIAKSKEPAQLQLGKKNKYGKTSTFYIKKKDYLEAFSKGQAKAGRLVTTKKIYPKYSEIIDLVVNGIYRSFNMLDATVGLTSKKAILYEGIKTMQIRDFIYRYIYDNALGRLREEPDQASEIKTQAENGKFTIFVLNRGQNLDTNIITDNLDILESRPTIGKIGRGSGQFLKTKVSDKYNISINQSNRLRLYLGSLISSGTWNNKSTEEEWSTEIYYVNYKQWYAIDIGSGQYIVIRVNSRSNEGYTQYATWIIGGTND